MSIQAFPMISHAGPLPWIAKRPLLTIREIQATVCKYYELDPSCMLSARRPRSIARPRQIAMYLARELTPCSYPMIGRHFGNRDHTTIIHGARTIERLIITDDWARTDVAALRERLAV